MFTLTHKNHTTVVTLYQFTWANVNQLTVTVCQRCVFQESKTPWFLMYHPGVLFSLSCMHVLELMRTVCFVVFVLHMIDDSHVTWFAIHVEESRDLLCASR